MAEFGLDGIEFHAAIASGGGAESSSIQTIYLEGQNTGGVNPTSLVWGPSATGYVLFNYYNADASSAGSGDPSPFSWFDEGTITLINPGTYAVTAYVFRNGTTVPSTAVGTFLSCFGGVYALDNPEPTLVPTIASTDDLSVKTTNIFIKTDETPLEVNVSLLAVGGHLGDGEHGCHVMITKLA